MTKGVSAEDYCSISDFVARYFRYVDLNRTEEWLALWVEDGVIELAESEPFTGHDELKIIPQMSADLSGGKMCHSYTNLSCDYDGGPDRVTAEFYELVTNWRSGGAFQMLGMCKASLQRDGNSWKMRRNEVKPVR